MINNNSVTTMINTGGRVIEVRAEEVELKRGLGWKIVVNPRQPYYIEFDLSAGGRAPNENMMENLELEDILPGRYI